MKDFNTAIVLAGGKSTRMGFDKQLLKTGEERIVDRTIKTLEQVFEQIIIVTNRPELYRSYPHKTVRDRISEFGPLAGIQAGLEASDSFYNYVVACDMPNINVEYIDYMRCLIEAQPDSVDGVVTLSRDRIEPFNAFYSRRLLQRIENHIRLNHRRLLTLVEVSKMLYVSEQEARAFSPDWEMFRNINTRKELENYLNPDAPGRRESAEYR